MNPSATAKSSLPSQWAFVVQFRTGTTIEQGQCTGRVEHVVSRQAIHCHSREELLAFMARVLTIVRLQPPEEP
jgi:hypothetical protein